jgi:hypothetical protein
VYDEQGRLVKTVIYREPEWNDEDRAKALALLEWEQGGCQCGCNQRLEDVYNPKQAWMIHTVKCTARVMIEKTKRQDMDKARRQYPDGKLPDGWNDGVRYFAVKADTPPGADKPIEEQRREMAVRARERRMVKTSG